MTAPTQRTHATSVPIGDRIAEAQLLEIQLRIRLLEVQLLAMQTDHNWLDVQEIKMRGAQL